MIMDVREAIAFCRSRFKQRLAARDGGGLFDLLAPPKR
jgi:hypothetical protein